MLRIVPMDLREASYALGIPKWKTIVRIVIPTARRVLYPTLLLWLNLGSPRLGVSRWVRVDGVCTG